MKFSGTKAELQDKLQQLGYSFEIKETDNFIQFRMQDGGILNWYPSTKTLQCQGASTAKSALQSKINTILDDNNTEHTRPVMIQQVETITQKQNSAISPSTFKSNGSKEKVFVVHGHDENAREQLELILHKLGLEPFVLQNTGGSGLTIIEALENEIGSATKTKFGIVLLTPDDLGYSQSEGSENIKPRARQNVVLEMGMLLSSIGRRNVAILQKGYLETPSDAQGILYIPFNKHVKETVPKLADRLQASGFELDAAAISKASS
ncbi:MULTISPECIES: nucleotide-binding protein [unclassified Neisseria]|uniref:nucleotide-binding protein n=1 Tax=unclassified Neisseria TaxID=2623750 RepID=UPI0026661AB3|nr:MULTISPECIES: nucleotide-binding protein [unclassified Neisseria]MDO1509311.1 nucleotide-binding protein [Neisseria sp. MVDL19-042950]MDO1515410.1 nucleotide-binding protein [Neisseria sp. MVDL18-041461]MDO1562770.1 nucleotide-binding protein [Neisseria sp. MVDL20-010259]